MGETTKRIGCVLLSLSVLAFAVAAGAQEQAASTLAIDGAKVAADTMWTLITAFLVMFMALGFALLESGFCRAKNTANILAKNVVVFAITSIAYLMLGWGVMFGDGNGYIGMKGLWLLSGPDNSPATGDAYKGVYNAISWTGIPLEAKFLFQLVFAATGATIVSGAVAERIRFPAFFIFSLFMGALFYPMTGHWIWGGGWLAERGMWDFAGSTVVHSVGGWAALAGALMLGPRIGKYTQDRRPVAIPGHSLTSATIGVFVLWFGWFGFNPGSTMAADWATIGHIATTTNTAAAAAVVAATFTAWVLLGKPDLTMSLNGAVAGLVAITAPCAFVSVGSSVIIGLVAGVLVVLSVLFFDRIRVDDPVGAISAHLSCGIWGTLSVGLFAQDQFMPGTTGNGFFYGGGVALLGNQVTGIVAVGAFIFTVSLITWALIKVVMGIRVPVEEELEGLDLGEHGHPAYPDFQIVTRIGERERATLQTEMEKVERERRRIMELMGSTEEQMRSVGVEEARSSHHRPGGELRRQSPAGFSRTPPKSPSPLRETPRTSPKSVATSVGGFSEGPVKITVDNVDRTTIRKLWEQLCHDYPDRAPQDFKEIYNSVISFRDNTFTLKKGDARYFADKIQRILDIYGISGAEVRAE
ncbi:MAG: ammonium transporter [Candidatus Binatia bacterium]